MSTAWIKEFLHRETFHTVSYVASIVWILLAPLFLAPLVVPKQESTSDYRCNGEDKAPVRDKCFTQFKQYYERTSASFFVRYFGIINFFAITIVFLIYSLCMKSKVRFNSQENGILLFCAYFVQLASRFVLHIVSIVLFSLLYFKNDLNFECNIKTEGSDWVDLRASNFIGKVQTYECFIRRETTGFFLTLTLIVLNGVFGLVAVTEIIWMLIRSRGHYRNAEFLSYLNRNPTNEERLRLLGPDTQKQHYALDEPDNPGPSVTVDMSALRESIKTKMKNTRLDLRKSEEYHQGDKVAAVLLNLWINPEDMTNGYELTELNLGFTNITDEGAKHISDALKNDNCKLTQLYLDGNRIGSTGARHLSDALTNENCKLTLLKIGEDITNQGVEFMRFSLTDSNCKLTELHVSGKEIGNIGASYLSSALTDANCKLTNLYLHGNKIGDEGARHLVEALKICKLEELTLFANEMGNLGEDHMHKALQHGICSLNRLRLGGNRITKEKFVQEKRIGETIVSVGECVRREKRSAQSGVRTKQMIAKTGQDETAKRLFSP